MSTFIDALNEFSYASSERGRKYFLRGNVIKVEYSNYSASAIVKGSGENIYSVKLKFNKKYELVSNSCSCPVGYFCKHAAATLYALDEMMENNELEMNEERLVGPKSEWRVEVDKIFNKYFALRYRFHVSYGPLNTFMMDKASLYKDEKIDCLTYITKRIFEFVLNYYYDEGPALEFLNRIYNNNLKKDEYPLLLELLKKDDKKKYALTLTKLILLKDYNYETNIALEEELKSNGLGDYRENEIHISLAHLSPYNLAYICHYNQRAINYYQARDYYGKIKKENLSDNSILRRSALMIYFIKSGRSYELSSEDYEIIREYNILTYRDLIFSKYMEDENPHDFALLINSYEDKHIEEKYETLLKKYTKKHFYIAIYFHQPVFLEDASLSEIVLLTEINSFFKGYETALINLALKKINHAKKLKNFDGDIEDGLYILDYYHYEDIISVILDKLINKKMIEADNGLYLYLLYKYQLLETLGYFKYGIPRQ